MTIDRDILRLTFNHLVFPPKLPGKQDGKVEHVERDLLTRLRTAVGTLKSCSDDEALPVWEGIEESLSTCQLINEDKFVNKVALKTALNAFKSQNVIILHVTQQNAGLLIRSSGDKVVFEAWEASPSAEKTLAAKGAMQWDFPTVAVSMPRKEFENAVFQENLVSFLERASLEPLEEFAAKARKAGVSVSEARDTVDPSLITNFLMTLIEVIGSRENPPILRKRIKDDVCWDESELPWRRSPLWLSLRVSIQRFLYQSLGEERGRPQYKFFICIVLSQLLTQCVHAGFDVELCSILRAKLCRRLAKLESEMKTIGTSALPTYSGLFTHVSPICQDAIEVATFFIKTKWNAFKSDSVRKIPSLPRRAYDKDLNLTLPNSGAYLRSVLSHSHHPVPRGTGSLAIDSSILDSNSNKATTTIYSSLLQKYCTLDDLEMNDETMASTIPESQDQCAKKCQKLATKICDYIGAVGDAYDGNTEQMSVFILAVFELWMYMDQCAIIVHPSMRQFHPFFKAEMLDILLLSRLHDLQRLRTVQEYIHTRCTQAERSLDIFADPQEGCFADRYFVAGDTLNVQNLNRLQDRIEAASMKAGQAKERELQKINAEYENRTQKMMQHSCTQRRNPDGSHDIKGCTHCWHVRSRRRLKIAVHEDFLPRNNTKENITQKRVILFELDTPLAFSCYRSATWEIINRLSPQPKFHYEPEKLLKDYHQLSSYQHDHRGNLSLASTTKSFLGTHYNFRHLPAGLDDILLPLGLTFSYYDSSRKIWANDIRRPLSFAHHFVLRLPGELPLSNLYATAGFAADGDGPSSYDAIASISECPSELTIHEYTAHQNLIGGKNRRWLSILTELGSSNVNFSLQDTMILFHHLSLQAGPRLDNDDLRVVHVVFRDYAFCRKLLHQIEQHVEAISQNWRENHYMETLLTLTIQVCTLGHKAVLNEANAILAKIRSVTLTWIKILRDETRTTRELDIAERSARYGFLAALLCRRTFYLAAYEDVSLVKESLIAFVEATLAMQENLVVDLSKFSTITLNILIRDIKMAHRLRFRFRRLVHEHPSSLESAIDTFWPNSTDHAREYSPWQSLHAPHEWWVTSTVIATEYTVPQTVHYHLLEGHLLIDGKALGKLPAAIRDSEILKDLFGNQRLVSFPSNLPGMNYMLSIPQEGYHIHLGYRGQQLVIQALKGRERLELIPSHIFGNETSFDIPRSLIHDCVHWLDLQSGNLEARRKPDIWRRKFGNWTIELGKSQAIKKNSYLVDPKSKTFNLVSQVFRCFAHPYLLTVYQPLKGYLSVEIKSMDLIFEVNRQHLFLCRQLGAEIDPNQDAGTLYGLKSMIVLRDAKNPLQRSVITTLGELRYKRSGVHVEIMMENSGSYAVYSIDSILGRLHCPPEPRLLYNKAHLHALTSFVIPDPLTGRTGTEEALRCLQSASCQPWNPLIPQLVMMLQSIASLTPQRQYYPKDLRRQQKVSWNPNLTVTIQHDSYRDIVDSILNKSQRLWLFHPNAVKLPEVEDQEPTSQHLRERAHWRRSVYERPEEFSNTSSPVYDFKYTVRGGKKTQSGKISNVREILTLLRQQPTLIRTTHCLKGILKEWPIIGGYAKEFVSFSISDCLNADLAHEWGGLVNICRKSPQDNYNPMFLLGLMAFSEGVDMRLLTTLVAFFLLDDLKTLPLPKCPPLSGLDMDQEPSLEDLINTIRPFCRAYEQNPPGRRNKKDRYALEEEARQLHEEKCLKESTSFAKYLLQQWPTREPSADDFVENDYLHKYEALDAIAPRWQQLYEAFQFSMHISEVQKVLDLHYAPKNTAKESTLGISDVETYGLQRKPGIIIPRLSEVLSDHGNALLWRSQELDEPMLKPNRSEDETPRTNEKPNLAAEITELEDIVSYFVRSDCNVRSNYGRDLERSIDALKNMSQRVASNFQGDVDLDGEIIHAQERINYYHSRLFDSFSFENARYTWLCQADLWPSMNPISILEQLQFHSSCKLSENMKRELVNYALAITKLQHLNRMKDAVLKKDQAKLRQEHNNPGHTNWDPNAFPDWLLLEIDANIHIREDQVTVALEMISPTSGSNSVLQMNMGQGKTSVIMPMVACVLADRQMLARLLVPNALLSQTAQILQSRLGGLLDREIRHIPFSRRTPTTDEHIQEYQNLQHEILNTGGIILAIPEHVLSFKLCGLQRVSDGKLSEAKQMVTIQGWMDQVCRDILDECDFTLATKTQLVYPSGAQLTVDGHPQRWKVTQIVLDLVAHGLRELSWEFKQSIDVIERGISAFPIVHILRKDVERALIKKIVNEICAGRTSILPIGDYTKAQQQAVRKFISQEDVEPKTVQVVVKLFADAPVTRKIVYLLRGLLVHGILLLCLKKRWNVQYGLHPKRDPVAVPFHAKGVPSEQAEWGHPDVAILFTCLAFYYHGLDQRQIRQSLQDVLKSDDPATEYDQWTHSSITLPDALRHWNIINVDDEGQITEIWHHLRFSTVVVNHFLNHFVFPAHAKQFTIKLQASGWDVPLFSLESKISVKNQRQAGITTGFSGTNDNRRLLPLTVEQQDLPELLHTNAEVLTYLLQERNREYVLATNSQGRRFSELDLLIHLREKKIRILIDAGAFVLEMDNETLVKEWLKKDWEAQAAVYFGSDNKAWVQYRAGKNVPLIATPFADNLEGCLVYLDEAHTRGTDLKLPAGARGALTLGLNQTKDHTVQAAMRMRQLGTTQSIMYVAPPEVHQSIQDVCKKRPDEILGSSHVVTWLLHQTCNNIEEMQPLYFSQGKDFSNRMQAAATYDNFLSDSAQRRAFMEVLQQPEQQDLEQIYQPRTAHHNTASSVDSMNLTGKLVTFQEELKQRQLGSRNLNGSVKGTAFEEVEQEREVAFQVEEEREVQRPQRMRALEFPGLHKTIRDFVTTGLLNGDYGYRKASKALEMAKISSKYGTQASTLLGHLYISTEFLRTVKTKNGAMLDNFTRPVNWVLWSELTETALVIIPEEAELVIPLLRSGKASCVHLLLYAAPVTRKMVHFDNLMYYDFPMLPVGWKAPPWLSFELGILAGRLYFNFSDYDGVVEKLYSAEKGENTNTDQSGSLSDAQMNTKNMLAFLNEWLALRRQGQDITHTPMGYVCHGRQLRSDHPFFMQRTVDQTTDVASDSTEQYQRHLEEEDEGKGYSDSDGESEGSVEIIVD